MAGILWMHEPGELFEVDPQIIIDACLYFVLERIRFDLESVPFQKIYINRFFHRVYNPILPYPGICVES